MLCSVAIISIGATHELSTHTIQFIDITKQSGIQFHHYDGRNNKKYYVETLGSGVTLFDYDNDGDLDIFFVNGTNLDDPILSTATDHLYRNNGDGSFTDVTEQAGVRDKSYGVGCCVSDYNNDGWTDLYVTNYGDNVLYRNNGDGTFSNITPQTGTNCDKWSSGCAFADVDNDGDLDLYVANYVEYSIKRNRACRQGHILVYCSPRVYEGIKDIFFRNNGDGTFSEETEKAGFGNFAARGLGVIFGDYDNDSDIDLFVANDADQNFLYRNDGTGHFEDVSLTAGVAFNEDGMVQNGMGVDFGDYDNDGWMDLIVTNFQHQANTLYHNDRNGLFMDVSSESKTGEVSLPYLAWGVNFVDYDNDGFKDLFVANGHIHDNVHLFDPSTTYAQVNHLFHNNRDRTFIDVAKNSPGLELVKVSRGSAMGDLDNDGDMDLVVSNLDQTADLLRNDGGNQSGNWLILKLVGTESNRSGIGARVMIYANNECQIAEVRSGSSYLSQNDLRLHFGLAKYEKIALEVRWPSGKTDKLNDLATNQFTSIIEGRGHLWRNGIR